MYSVALIWIIHIVKILGNFQWNYFGIYPRKLDGLVGIVAAPLLHADFQHLFSNSLPLFIILVIIYLFYNRVATLAFISVYFLTGLAVWSFGRQVYHIGASGVVYGLISFVFWSGLFRKNFKSVVISLVIILLYSGYLGGIVPGKEGISWESHLLGAIVGMVIAFLLRHVIEDHEKEPPTSYENEIQEERYFFDRDIFEEKRL